MHILLSESLFTKMLGVVIFRGRILSVFLTSLFHTLKYWFDFFFNNEAITCFSIRNNNQV